MTFEEYQQGIRVLEAHLSNIESGLQLIIICVVAFFVWKIINVVYGLIAGILFGGL